MFCLILSHLFLRLDSVNNKVRASIGQKTGLLTITFEFLCLFFSWKWLNALKKWSLHHQRIRNNFYLLWSWIYFWDKIALVLLINRTNLKCLMFVIHLKTYECSITEDLCKLEIVESKNRKTTRRVTKEQFVVWKKRSKQYYKNCLFLRVIMCISLHWGYQISYRLPFFLPKYSWHHKNKTL